MKFFDRVKETSTSTGTTDFTLSGAVSKFRTFNGAGVATGDLVSYLIEHQGATEWEVGIGKLTSSTVLARLVINASSNSNALVNFSAGNKEVSFSNNALFANFGASEYFGDGSDGDVTVTTSITLTRDMYYKNLTISGSGSINTAGYRVYVSEILDITAAGQYAIHYNGNNGSSTSNTVGANGGGTLASNTIGGAGNSSNGTNGGTTTGQQPGSGGSTNPGNGGASGAGGAGGSGSSGAGGASRVGSTVSNAVPLHRFADQFTRMTSATAIAQILGGCGAPAGSSGGGDGTAGGGSGGGGSGAGVVFVSARIINRGGSTAASSISARGGNGGNGGAPAGGNRGGGGGGGGAGGGWIVLCYAALMGSSATGALGVNGGTGGNAGNGTGTGVGGSGGTGGAAGRISTLNLSTNVLATTGPGTGGTAGSAGSGNTGGNGGGGETSEINL